MRTSGLGKYQAIVAAITMFVFFIVAVMALNFYISMQFESDAVGVNLAYFSFCVNRMRNTPVSPT